MRQPTQRLPLSGTFLIGAVLFGLSLSFAISVGAVSVPIDTVWGVFFNRTGLSDAAPSWSAGRAAIVWEIRFPRALLAAMVGAGLAIVGASLQAVTRNPLADPHLLGISSGGAFGAVAALLHTGLFMGLLTVPLMAFLGALMATAMVPKGRVRPRKSTSDRSWAPKGGRKR
jgi:iron complex transport system permease protein